MGRLDGKVAVITGSGRGIGRATAILFAAEGAAVVVNDVDRDPAEETAKDIQNAGGRATTSTAALLGNAGQANYTAAKGAIVSLTRTLARELGPFHINVNAVAPGFIDTRLTAPKAEGQDLGVPEQNRQMALLLVALGYAGQPEDVARVHVFLASEDADYVSGVILPVSGAMLGA